MCLQQVYVKLVHADAFIWMCIYIYRQTLSIIDHLPVDEPPVHAIKRIDVQITEL